MLQEGQSASPESPFAKFRGELVLGDASVDCYVLDTGQRVINLRAVVRAIANKDRGDLAGYIEANALKSFINSDLILAETVEFNIPGTQYQGRGVEADRFLDICRDRQ